MNLENDVICYLKQRIEDPQRCMQAIFLADWLWFWQERQRLVKVYWIKQNGKPYAEKVEQIMNSCIEVELTTKLKRFLDTIVHMTEGSMFEYNISALLKRVGEGEIIDFIKLRRGG